MDDLISRKEAIDIVRYECGEWEGLAKEIIKQFNELPPVDAVPVRREKWRYKTVDSGYHTDKICPVCKSQFAIGWNFCPNCGTDMREEDSNG